MRGIRCWYRCRTSLHAVCRVAAAAAARPSAGGQGGAAVTATGPHTAPPAVQRQATGSGAWASDPGPPLPAAAPQPGVPLPGRSQATHAAQLRTEAAPPLPAHSAADRAVSHAGAWSGEHAARSAAGRSEPSMSAPRASAHARSRWDSAPDHASASRARAATAASRWSESTAGRGASWQPPAAPPQPPSGERGAGPCAQLRGGTGAGPSGSHVSARLASQSALPPPPDEQPNATPPMLAMRLGGGAVRSGGTQLGSTGTAGRSGLAAALAAKPTGASQSGGARAKVASMFGHDSSGDEG